MIKILKGILEKRQKEQELQQRIEKYLHLIKNWNYNGFNENDLNKLEELRNGLPKDTLVTYEHYYNWIYEHIQIKEGKFPSIKAKGIVLKKDEIWHLELFGVKMHRHSPNLFRDIHEREMNQNIKGTIYMTNKRFIFLGERNVTYSYNHIVKYSLKSVDNIILEKENQHNKERFNISGHPRQYKALNEMKMYLSTYLTS
ncbi:hypothetical protein GN156_07135 [bacterium LRH843]|nr:hypothetical protein [bacterium LRH843]